MKKKEKKFEKEKVQSVVIIVLSLIIVFGLAYFVPELKNCGNCKTETKEGKLSNTTISKYEEILAGDIALVYLASPSCGYCQQQEPIMKEINSEYGVTINYINTSSLSEDDATKLYESYGSLQEAKYGEDGIRTPTILFVEKGKVVDVNLGVLQLEELEQKLISYELIKE